ncbi:MAG: hypothetical protein ACLRZH_19255 [Ruthenibacterium lactatiformans]
MRDFTRIPNRPAQQNDPFGSQGCSAWFHLTLIPHFHLNPDGVRAFCAERLKRFRSVARTESVAASAPLPHGQEDGFSYQYGTCGTGSGNPVPYEPPRRRHRVYCQNNRGVFKPAGKKLRALRPFGVKTARTRSSNAAASVPAKAAKPPYTPSQAEIEAVRQRIDAGRLKWQYDAGLVDMATGALAEIENAPELMISKRTVPLADRAQLASAFTYDDMSSFLRTKTDLSHAGNPAAYLRTVLFKWMQEHPHTADQPVKPLKDWEREWLERVKEVRRRRLAAEAGQQNMSTT